MCVLHIIDLGLHAHDYVHLSGDLNEGLAVIESLEDSGSVALLESLDGSGLGDGGISLLGLRELLLNRNRELILIHGLINFHSLEELGLIVVGW